MVAITDIRQSQLPDIAYISDLLPDRLYGTSKSQKLIAEFKARAKSRSLREGPWEISDDEYAQWCELINPEQIGEYLVFGITPDHVRKVIASAENFRGSNKLWNAYTISCILRNMAEYRLDLNEHLVRACEVVRYSVDMMKKTNRGFREVRPISEAPRAIKFYSQLVQCSHANLDNIYVPINRCNTFRSSPPEWTDLILEVYKKLCHLPADLLDNIYEQYLSIYLDADKISSTVAADIAVDREDLSTLKVMRMAQIEHEAEFLPEDADRIAELLSQDGVPLEWIAAIYADTDEVKRMTWEEVQARNL